MLLPCYGDDDITSNSVAKFSVPLQFDVIIENMELDQENDSLAIIACKEEIKLDALIEIFTLYEFGRYLDYSEYYEATYKSKLDAKPLYKAHVSKLDSAIVHNVSKKNAYEYIIKSLKFLNQFETVAKLDELFNLSEYFDFAIKGVRVIDFRP
jgi:hypothetical protein